MRRDDGGLGVFVAVVTMAAVLVAGLLVDGGRLLTARRQAYDIAAAAARAGAQAIDTVTVEVAVSVRMLLLVVVGADERTVTATASARVVQGVGRQEG